MRVRPMSIADAARVAELCGQLGYPATPAQLAARFSDVAGGPASCVFVAEDAGGRVVGWIHVLARRLVESEPCAELGGLVVDEAARRSGVGRALVAAAEGWAAEHGFSEVCVRTNVERPAAPSFYRGVGYELIKTSHKFRKRLCG